MTRPSILPLALLPLLALAACGPKAADTNQAAASDEPTAPSSEWVAENPTEAAVPVTVPTTPMTNAPASPAASESGK